MTETHFLAIETGGTKLIARLERGDGTIIGTMRRPTSGPDAALADIVGFVESTLGARKTIAGVGMAAFGPLVLDLLSVDHGRLLATPKPGWSGANLRAMLADALGAAVTVDSDVNAAARAEQQLGAGQGFRSVAYITVGTGIGGGLAIDGTTLSGYLHPEIGHLRLIRAAGDTAPSTCPFHPDCAEGLAAGPAIGARLGPGRVLVDDPALQQLVAHYLGQLAASITLAWSPDRIVWGGGVMSTAGLMAALIPAMRQSLHGYDQGWRSNAPDYCVAASLADAGLEGAMLMARGQVAGGPVANL